MHASGQLSFSDAEFDGKKKVTRRERLLGQLESLLPWPDLIALIEPHYPTSGRPGQQPLPLASLLRVHVAQIAYHSCDRAMEDALYEVASLRRFCRVELATVPDDSTILRFRRMLEEDGLAPAVFAAINRRLGEQGLFLKQGTIVDASLIAAPSSTKNATGERDPAMHQSKKGEQWHFGGKVHIGVDDQTGLTHTLTFTAGNVADVAEAANVLCGEEESLLGDAGYQGASERLGMHRSHVKTIATAMRPGKLSTLTAHGGALAETLRAAQHELARRRAKVEHVFRDLKIRFGYANTRWKYLLAPHDEISESLRLSDFLRFEQKST